MAEKHPFIILGAGPAGLTAALKLSQAGKRVIVLEKRSLVGGISSSRYWNDFIIEFGPHAYHVKRDRVDEIVKDYCNGHLPDKERNIKMLVKGKLFDYPLKFWQLVQGLNLLFSAKMVGDFLYTSLKFKIMPRPDESFQTWGMKKFGKTLYNLCFGQYTERVWGIPATRISVRLASQKLHQLNLKDILIKLLGGKGQEQATYWKYFLYPEEGMGIVFKNMASRIKESGGEVWLNSWAEKISIENDRLVSVTVRREGDEVVLPCSGVISTIPLAYLSQIVASHLDPGAAEAGRNLKNRSLILVNLVLNVPSVSDSHWVYLLDPIFRFNRFCEQKNLLADKKPYLKTLVTLEVCCNYGDHLWEAGDQYLLNLALEDIDHIKIIDGRRVSDCLVQKVKDAYPIYDLDYERRLERILTSLAAIKNLYSAGRQGLFLNTDMHDSMEMGVLAAEEALSGEESRFWYEKMIPYLDFKTGGTNQFRKYQ